MVFETMISPQVEPQHEDIDEPKKTRDNQQCEASGDRLLQREGAHIHLPESRSVLFQKSGNAMRECRPFDEL